MGREIYRKQSMRRETKNSKRKIKLICRKKYKMQIKRKSERLFQRWRKGKTKKKYERKQIYVLKTEEKLWERERERENQKQKKKS